MSQFFVEAGAAAGSVIETINNVSPDATDNFTLEAGPGIFITDITNGLEISNTGVLEINTQPPIGGNFLILPGTNCSISSGPGQSVINCSASGGSGGIVVSQNRAITSAISSSSSILLYTSTPTTGNTSSLLSITFTPANANNILVFNWTVPYESFGHLSTIGIGAFVFNGSTFLSGIPHTPYFTSSGLGYSTASGQFYMTAGSASSQTYTLRVALLGASGGSVYINSDSNGSPFFGSGGSSAVFTITEISPTGTSNPLTPITPVTHGNSPYTVLMTDQYLSCDPTMGTIEILMPNSTLIGRGMIIKDATGQAAANNITVTTPGGTTTFDGQTTYTMNQAYQSITIDFSGTTYEVI